MWRQGRDIACVGSLLDLARAQHLTRRTGNLSVCGGEYRGGHCHQRKLFFSCAGVPANEIAGHPADYWRRRTGWTFSALSAGMARLRPDLLLAQPGFPVKRGSALGELPTLSFWKDWLFRLFPEKFFVMRGGFDLPRPGS